MADPTTLGIRNTDPRTHVERLNPLPGATATPEEAAMTEAQFATLVDLLTPISEAAKLMLAEQAKMTAEEAADAAGEPAAT